MGNLAKRHTPESTHNHFDGTESELIELIKSNWHRLRPGYRDGVVTVPVPPERFYSNMAEPDANNLRATYSRRTPEEDPRMMFFVSGGKKLPAKRAEIALYSSEVLAIPGANGRTSNLLPPEPGNWEIVKIIAVPDETDPPIHFMTILHNHFESSGGTPTGWDAERFESEMRKSFLYWKNRATLG